MYGLYRKSLAASKVRYEYVEQVSLFGCNEGYIPWLLSFQIPVAQGEPFKWRVDIEPSLAQRDDVNGNALIIDLKPSDTSSVRFMKLLERGDIPTPIGPPSCFTFAVSS